MSTARPERTVVRNASLRNYLMCRPTYFAVEYAINPWMHPDKPVDAGLAIEQWETLRSTYEALGHEVRLIEPREGLPDMVFAANGAVVVDGKAYGSRFRFAERASEGEAYLRWLKDNGATETLEPGVTAEGEGDFLTTKRRILAGFGFRTDRAAHAELARLTGREVVSLELIDPRFYHLDTAFAVLAEADTESDGEDTVMYLPEAFTPGSREVLRRLYPNAILADVQDAEVLGLNAVSDGRRVVLPMQAKGLIAELVRHGFEPIGVDMSELRKAGGGPKCCTLELRGLKVSGGPTEGTER